MSRRPRVRRDWSACRCRLSARSLLGSLIPATVLAACTRSISADLVPLDQLALVPAHASTDRIERRDLGALDGVTLAEAITRLRPEWLRANPSARQVTEPARASVYMNDVYAGDASVLRSLAVQAVVGVRYLSPSRAHDRFGTGCRCAGGAILVTTFDRRGSTR